jgi:hypothetical protein
MIEHKEKVEAINKTAQYLGITGMGLYGAEIVVDIWRKK